MPINIRLGKKEIYVTQIITVTQLETEAARLNLAARRRAVPKEGVEPSPLAGYDPESYVSASSTTSAWVYYT